jgi:uncharacterized protein YggE
VNALFASGVRYFVGVDAEYSKAREAAQETQELAIKNARAEADRIAELSGMKVDSVWALSTDPFSRIGDHMVGGSSESFPVADMRAVTKSEVAPEYRLAPIHFDNAIHVIFLISPKK